MTTSLYVVIDRKCLPMLPTVTPVKAMAIRDAQDYNAMPSREHQRPFGVARLKVVECMFSPECREAPPTEKETE